jgi:predicted house-cleaning noncanonical NTP pyrophosphatase (MazG superfamily)
MIREDKGTTKKKKYSDVVSRMRTAYNKNKDKIKNADTNKKDNTRQRKIDDLQNRPISWSGLHERQSNAMKRQEAYNYEEPRFNPFSKYTWEEVCDTIENMNETELDEFMDICDVNNIDDLYDYIATCFLLDEA